MIPASIKIMQLDNILKAYKQQQKFIIAKHPVEFPQLFLFDFYAVNLHSKEEPDHLAIVELFRIDPLQILGGGRISCPVRPHGEEIVLYDSSSSYGSIPKGFLNLFYDSLLKQYQQRLEYDWLKRLVVNAPEHSDKDVF